MNHRAQKVLLAAAALVCLVVPQASAASLWGSVNLNTDSVGVTAGFGILPLPLVGTFGVEGSAERLGTSGQTAYSVGATLRDINLPLTGTDAFLGAGVTYVTAFSPYLEGGLRAPLIGPAGLKIAVRSYPQQGRVRAGLGAEVRF